MNLTKFYSIFLCMKKMFSRRNPANYFLIFNVEFGNNVSIARFFTQGCGIGAKNFRCLELEPERVIRVQTPQSCHSGINTGWLTPPASRVW